MRRNYAARAFLLMTKTALVRATCDLRAVDPVGGRRVVLKAADKTIV
jgi:hypothetical protein